MKILFVVNPRSPKSLWGFPRIADNVGVQSGQALATLARSTRTPTASPSGARTSSTTERSKSKRRGKFVAVGGPYPSLCPERSVDGPFDVVFEGDAERTWSRIDQFIDYFGEPVHTASNDPLPHAGAAVDPREPRRREGAGGL